MSSDETEFTEFTEFIQFVTSKPQALGQVLEMMGFRPVTRLYSCYALLCCQGDMNIIINAHNSGLPRAATTGDAPVTSAIALRVGGDAAANRHAVDRRDWAVPQNVGVMEHNIIAIHDMGQGRL